MTVAKDTWKICLLTNTRTGETVEYRSMSAAAKAIGRVRSYIRACHLRNKTIYGIDGTIYTAEVRERSIPEMEAMGRKVQLCFFCKNAVYGCSWSKRFEPVEGWTAEPTTIRYAYNDVKSYHITACPQFEEG